MLHAVLRPGTRELLRLAHTPQHTLPGRLLELLHPSECHACPLSHVQALTYNTARSAVPHSVSDLPMFSPRLSLCSTPSLHVLPSHAMTIFRTSSTACKAGVCFPSMYFARPFSSHETRISLLPCYDTSETHTHTPPCHNRAVYLRCCGLCDAVIRGVCVAEAGCCGLVVGGIDWECSIHAPQTVQ